MYSTGRTIPTGRAGGSRGSGPAREGSAVFVDQDAAETIDVLGPTVQFLTPSDEDGEAPCLMRGTIPPGGSVPLHSHPDPETFVAVSGELEVLVHRDGRFDWAPVRPGDVVHVPGGAKHAFRNRSPEPAVQLLVSTATIGRFFREIGTPVGPGSPPPGPPSGETLARFLATAERYGHWTASPEENAEVGLTLPQP